MPVIRLDPTRKSVKASVLASTLDKRIVGQPAAKDALIGLLEKYQSGFYDKTKPIGSLLFLGATGVGKTGAVEAFTEGLIGNPTAFMKVDCGEFQHSHEIAKLQGSPPGYLGHRETKPFFTNESIKSHQVGHLPITVILFDEIEKASDALWTLLLGILDKGSLTTGTNEKVDMTSTIIIMTSNVGSSELAAKAGDGGLGFIGSLVLPTDDEMKDTAMAAARRKFMPEFLGRLDEVVMFNTLTPEDLTTITGFELQKLSDRVLLHSERAFEFEVSPAAFAQILSEGYDRKYNARNLKKTIDKHVGLPLGRLVATGQVENNATVIVDYRDGKWEYNAESKTVSRFTAGSVAAG